MINIGIISGSGPLPIIIGKNLIKKNYNVIFFSFNELDKEKNLLNLNIIKININSIKEIINKLKENRIDKIIMAGNITRPSLSDLSFDFETVRLAKKLFLEKKGDDLLLNTIQKYFEEKGFPFLDWTDKCKEIFSIEKNFTKNKPSNNALKNLEKGKAIFKLFGKTDIGQSVIIQNQLVLGLEAVEGTDTLIKRCFNYKKKGDKGILLKFNKYSQSALLDIPTIGLETIKLLHKYEYEGVFLEKDKCIILNKDEVKNYAESNNIFISAVKKID